ncbi:MAG: hypothetical protein LBR80_07895 [Deltaproteobacteria bacterium]|nr:hypothetical protein [Deltaproteobacteria bacterium]
MDPDRNPGRGATDLPSSEAAGQAGTAMVAQITVARGAGTPSGRNRISGEY